jgi:GTPase SAR1 family protein
MPPRVSHITLIVLALLVAAPAAGDTRRPLQGREAARKIVFTGGPGVGKTTMINSWASASASRSCGCPRWAR